MTNFKDLLRSFAHDVLQVKEEWSEDNLLSLEDELDELIETYLGSQK